MKPITLFLHCIHKKTIIEAFQKSTIHISIHPEHTANYAILYMYSRKATLLLKSKIYDPDPINCNSIGQLPSVSLRIPVQPGTTRAFIVRGNLGIG